MSDCLWVKLGNNFRSSLKKSSGRSHCGVKSLAKACVILQCDRAESVTAADRNMSHF